MPLRCLVDIRRGAAPPEEGATHADLEPGDLLADAGGSELLLHVTRPLARVDDWSVLKITIRPR
ncbi:hypothetical protein, partial [Intrasporangium sp.]|uniref:hypothetical protein n=1 Tax=Intrasporangium sp. TaxID=1925024 RepID=UPI002939E9C5